MSTACKLLLLAALMFAPPVAAERLYQWRDAAGRLHITDDATKVPPAARERSERHLTPLMPVHTEAKGEPEPQAGLDGSRLWRDKCAACHHTGSGDRDGKMGLADLTLDKATRFLREPEELLANLKYATSGRTTDMPEVEVSDAELLAIARYLLAAQQ